MTPFFRTALWVSVALLMSAMSHAQKASDVRNLLASGDFTAAYSHAEELETVEGYSLAAESLLTEIMLGRAEKNKKQAKRARKLAKAALELDPSNQNARLQHAIADGFVTRELSDMSAWIKKRPQKTLTIIQAYRDDFPNDPRGDALLGAWHLAIARKTGDKDAKKWFNASVSDGTALFASAHLAEPHDLTIGVNYAFALIALKDKDLSTTDTAKDILEKMILIRPSDFLTQTLQGYAREALERLNDREAARSYVGLFLDGKTPK